MKRVDLAHQQCTNRRGVVRVVLKWGHWMGRPVTPSLIRGYWMGHPTPAHTQYCIHTCIHAYIHACMHVYMAYMAYMHTCSASLPFVSAALRESGQLQARWMDGDVCTYGWMDV